MKLLVIGDLHGRKPKIHFKNFDAIILVGDICDDREFSPLRKKWARALKEDPENTGSIDEFIISHVGKRKLIQMEKDSLKIGRKILEDLNKLGKPIFMVAGNYDQSYGASKIKNPDKNDYTYYKAFLDWWAGDKINPKLVRGLKNIQNTMFHLHEFNNFNIIGYGLSSAPEKPGMKKRLKKISKSDMAKLARAYKKILIKLEKEYKKNKKLPTIFITHNVPYNTSLDIIKEKGSVVYNKHFGSTVARWFANKHKPLLCVGGHMHEHFKKTKIKKTIVINAGFGKDAQVLIELDEGKGKVKGIEFWKEGNKK